MMTAEEKRKTGAMIVGIGLSVGLSRLDVLSFLYMVPALIASSFFSDGKRFIPVGASGALALLVSILESGSALSSQVGKIAILVSAFFPVALWVSALLFVALDGKRMMRRYVTSILPGCVAAVGLLVFLSRPSEAVSSLDTLMSTTFLDLLGNVERTMGLSFGTRPQLMGLYHLVVMVLGSLLVPAVMVFCALNFWVCQSFVRRDKAEFSQRIAAWHVREDGIWVFLGAWLCVVASSLLKGSPLLEALVLNLAGGISVLYGIQGFCIMLFWLRRRNPSYTAGRLLGLLALITLFLPGLNALVVVVVPLLGVTETWIQYRRERVM